MIFVTVGTHEQSFDRLIKYMDNWAAMHNEEVVVQTGFSTCVPRNCRWKKLFPYSQMVENVKKARIVITHGGPSSFIMPLQERKIPIVVPRKKEFNEHVNNHQVDFCEQVSKKYRNIIVIKDENELDNTIKNYNKIVEKMSVGLYSNNKKFCEEFSKIVDGLVK